MTFRYSNNAETTLATAVTDSELTITVASGRGSIFPALAVGDWFPLYLINRPIVNEEGVLTGGGTYEIVRATSRNGDQITIEREQEGTVKRAFAANDIVSLRITERALNEFPASGVADFTVVRGINFGVAAGSANTFTATVPNVSAYTDNLKIELKPVGANTQPIPTVDVNGLGATPILLPDGSDLHNGAIEPSRIMVLRYRINSNDFRLQNPTVDLDLPPASVGTPGLIELGAASGFDESGDNTAAMTQQTVSQIIASRLATLPQNSPFDPTWSNFGRGNGGTIVADGTTEVLGQRRPLQVDSVTVDNGGTIDFSPGHASFIVRCRGKVLLNGEVIIPVVNPLKPYEPFVGPRGHPGAGSGSMPDAATEQLPLFGITGGGDRLHISQFNIAVESPTPLSYFHGGYGKGEVLGGGASPIAAPRAGLIIIAPEIEIGPNAVIRMPAVPKVGNGGDSAGGFLVTSTPLLTKSASAQYEMGAAGNLQNEAFWRTQYDASTSDLDSANGTWFAIDLSNNTTALIF